MVSKAKLVCRYFVLFMQVFFGGRLFGYQSRYLWLLSSFTYLMCSHCLGDISMSALLVVTIWNFVC